MTKKDKKFLCSVEINLYDDMYYDFRLSNTNPIWKQKENVTTPEDIKNEVVGILQSDLPERCKAYFDTPVEVNVKGSHDGSIVVVFDVIVKAIEFISGAKDAYDVAALIRNITVKLIEKRLDKKYGRGTFLVYGRNHNYREKDIYHPEVREVHFVNNNGFFWYLLISNIVLVICIFLLVYGAVMKTYF